MPSHQNATCLHCCFKLVLRACVCFILARRFLCKLLPSSCGLCLKGLNQLCCCAQFRAWRLIGRSLPVCTPCLASRLLKLLTCVQSCGSAAELECTKSSWEALAKRLSSGGLLVCQGPCQARCRSEQRRFAYLPCNGVNQVAACIVVKVF